MSRLDDHAALLAHATRLRSCDHPRCVRQRCDGRRHVALSGRQWVEDRRLDDRA